MDHEDIVTIHDRSNNEERIFPLRQSSNSNILEHYGNWLLSIPRDDMPLLSQTDEYEAFVNAFKNLELAHRKSILQHQEISQMEDRPVSFLQHLALDDMLLRIFEFLPCTTLVKTSQTCHRFHMLSKRSARQRTVHMKGYYYLGSEMKLLRAKEQIEGILPDHTPIVRVPLLGLGRRIYVSNSGDEEYNGIYFCTGSNGNGFLFTKPRDANEWSTQDLMEMEDDIVGGVGDEYRQRGNNLRERRDWNNSIINDEGEEIYPGRIPRCIISKRFSNETILWYMCKERIDGSGKVTQVFSFWAKLLVLGEGTPDICRYPSQTSILSRNGEAAWQSLTSTRTTTPPIVELMH